MAIQQESATVSPMCNTNTHKNGSEPTRLVTKGWAVHKMLLDRARTHRQTDRQIKDRWTNGHGDSSIPTPLTKHTSGQSLHRQKNRWTNFWTWWFQYPHSHHQTLLGGWGGGGGIRINKILDNKQKTHTQKTMTLSVNTVLSPNPPETWSTWWRSPPHRRRVPLPPLLGSSANGSGAGQRTWWAVGSMHRCHAPGW